MGTVMIFNLICYGNGDWYDVMKIKLGKLIIFIMMIILIPRW